MKSKISKIFSIFGAIATATTFGGLSSAAAQTQGSNDLESGSSNLADQMIQKNLFEMDASTNEIQVDNDALVASLKNELRARMKSSSLSQFQREKYETLLNNLQPGNYERFHNNAKDLQSMHFDGKKN
jgi:hypothetical protein